MSIDLNDYVTFFIYQSIYVTKSPPDEGSRAFQHFRAALTDQFQLEGGVTMADLVREAMEMIEDMGEALSLSLDDSEEDEERERGDEGVSDLHGAPHKRVAESPLRGDWDDERWSAKRRRGREATRMTTGRRLHQDLLALEESSSDDDILEASSDDEDLGAGMGPTSSVSLDSRRSDRDV